MKSFYYVCLCLLVGSMLSCNNSLDRDEYVKWLNNSENGLSRQQKSKGFSFNLKYLPADFFVYRALMTDTSIATIGVDSIRNTYTQNTYFLMTIDNDTSVVHHGGDIMYRDVENYNEYTQRIYDVNFSFDNKVYIVNDSKDNIYPVLTSFEHNYGLTSAKAIMVVFNRPLTDEVFRNKELVLVYEDDVFNSGKHYFRFDTDKIKSCPTLQL